MALDYFFGEAARLALIRMLLLVMVVFFSSAGGSRIISNGRDAGEFASLGGGAMHPVTIVGPTMGQSLEVRVDRDSPRYNSLCHSSEWQRAWGTTSKWYLNPLCFDVNFGLTWDKHKAAHAHPGVHVRPLGGVNASKALQVNTALTDFFGINFWYYLLGNLTEAGLEAGTSMIGHAYDFRLSVDQWQRESYPVLKADIEQIVAVMKKRTIVTALSMGAPYFHTFLQWTGRTWNKKHIEAFVPLDGPFNGAVSALQTLVGGFLASYDNTKYEQKCPACDPPLKPETTQPGVLGGLLQTLLKPLGKKFDKELTKVIRSFPSVYFLLPKKDTSKSPPEDPILVSFPQGTALSAKTHTKYRASDLPTFFREIIGDEDAASMAEYAQKFPTTADPGVPVHCIFGMNSQTPSMIEMREPRNVSAVVLGDGDRTVHADSLQVCERWRSTVKVYKLTNVVHGGAACWSDAIQILVSLAKRDKAFWQSWKPPRKWQEGNPPDVIAKPETRFGGQEESRRRRKRAKAPARPDKHIHHSSLGHKHGNGRRRRKHS